MANNPFFGIKVSKPGVTVQKATDKQLIYKDDFTSKIWYDNSNSRIVQGQLPDGTYGMWVSKPGFDATASNASSAGNLVFDSNEDVFKIVQTGTSVVTVSQPGGGGGTTFGTYVGTVTFSLTFTPIVFATLAATTSGGLQGAVGVPFPYTTFGSPSSVSVDIRVTSVSATSFDWVILVNDLYSVYNGTYTLKYYLLRESAT